MYLQEIKNSRIPDMRQYYILRDRNRLGLNKLTFIRDKFRQLLIILAESDTMISREVYVFLKENILVVEAPLFVDLEMPYRAHLIEKGNLDEFNKESSKIEFTEIKLFKKYEYNIISFNMIKPGLLKIVLSCKHAGSDKN
jgi:hypothetical protein